MGWRRVSVGEGSGMVMEKSGEAVIMHRDSGWERKKEERKFYEV